MRPPSMRRRRWASALARWGPLVVLAVIAFALTWLNRSPWWGWLLVAALLAVVGATARWWVRRHPILQVVSWLLAGTIVATAAILAYPAPQTRTAGGEDPAPSRPVQTREGPRSRRS